MRVGAAIAPIGPSDPQRDLPFYTPNQYSALKDEMSRYVVYAGLGGLVAGALLAWTFGRK